MAHLRSRGRPCELLDGSEVRESLSHDLGFSPEDREENVRRIGFVAKLLSRNGVIAVCATVSPYRSTRDEVRANTTNFVEVFVDCPLEVAESRDQSGRYARARDGSLPSFTGVDAPYEPPLAPEVHYHADRESVHEAVWRVVRALQALEVVPVVGTAADTAAEEQLRQQLGRSTAT